jgi:hypothetical protein
MGLGRLFGSSVAGIIPGAAVGSRPNESATMRMLGLKANGATAATHSVAGGLQTGTPASGFSTPVGRGDGAKVHAASATPGQNYGYGAPAPAPKSHGRLMSLWRKMTGGNIDIQWFPCFRVQYS